jgi:3-phenylpropionate/trans-cinnamate dioxygenase ferredoxin reductase subunit
MIVGASLAGAKAAETLRTEGFDGEVVLISEESITPYERLPLSKQYLRGEEERDEHKLLVHDEGTTTTTTSSCACPPGSRRWRRAIER